MSTVGISFRDGFLGSVAEGVLHSSRLPVLTVSPAKAEEYGQGVISRIVAPLDDSDLAETVLPYVEYTARKLGVEILLVRVVKPIHMFWMDELPTGLEQEQRRVNQDARNYLNSVEERLTSHGLNVKSRVLEGHSVTALSELAHELTNELITLATHGRAGVRRWTLGSVAAALGKAAGEPVLIIPPAEDAD